MSKITFWWITLLVWHSDKRSRWRWNLTCVVADVPPSRTSDWLALNLTQPAHWELQKIDCSIVMQQRGMRREREKQKLRTALDTPQECKWNRSRRHNVSKYKGLVKHTLICLCLWFLVPGTLVISCLQLLVLSPVMQQKNTWGQHFELTKINLSLPIIILLGECKPPG